MFKSKKAALEPLINNVIIVILGAFFMMMFIYSAIENSTNDSDQLSRVRDITTPINDSMADLVNSATDAQARLNSSKPNPVAYIFLIFEGAFYIPWNFLKVVGGSITSLGSILFPALGGIGATIFGIVITILLASMIIALIFAIIKSIRTGESER